MAFRDAVRNEEIRFELSGANFFWNLHDSVGYGCKNNKSDVMLVQFLLNSFNRNMVGASPNLLVPDGQFGGLTWREIKTFQKYELGSNPENNPSNGCVSTVNGTKYKSRKTKAPYTIYMLNMWYVNFYSMYFPDIRRDPKIPEPLIAQLTGMPQVV